MEMSVEWHEDCLNNRRRNLEKRRRRLENVSQEIEKEARNIDYYIYQINTAKREKKAGFDRNKYLPKIEE
jgi:prefoldin subunit 5